MESFFSLLQKNGPRPPALDRQTGAGDRDRPLDRTDHRRRRRQDALGRLMPIEYESTTHTPATQAA
jgi:hypothetical protein